MKFRVLDFETTGFPPVASVLEIGFTDVEWDLASAIATIHPTKSQLCKPLHRIELEAMAVHHIQERDIEDAPLCTTALKYLEQDINQQGIDILVAHHNEFERQFFNPHDAKWICTYKSSTHIWPESPRHTNQVLRYFLKLDLEPELSQPAHRAGPDTYVTAHILVEALKLRSIDELLALTTQPVVMKIVPFGKYKGKLWSEVPHDYMRWLLNQSTVTADVRATCQHWLKQPKPT